MIILKYPLVGGYKEKVNTSHKLFADLDEPLSTVSNFNKRIEIGEANVNSILESLFKLNSYNNVMPVSMYY